MGTVAIEEVTGRIAENLECLKRFTATPGDGCTRLPFTKEARDAVNYLREVMTEAGLEVHEDEAGNVIGILKGENPDLPCVMMGSHYDSVVNGGDFDGIAGVVCAIEAARQLKDEYCKHYKDSDGISIYDAMKGYGLDPEKIEDAKWPEGSIGKFLELHIEQGPVLDAKNIEIGLVDCIVGIQRYMVTVNGRADHAGTTPMDMRLDAVDAATKVISKIPDWAREKADGTVATIGYINTIPGGMNIVAEKCEFTVDIRSKSNDNINDIANRIRAALDREVKAMGGSYDIDTKLVIEPVMLDEGMLDIMEEDCKARGYSYMRLPSGAGHDALEIGQVLPTVMIFVPSKDGRSHCPVEFTKYSEFAKASVVMTGLAKKLLAE